MKFDRWGNDLYTGARSYGIVRNRRRWYVLTGVLVALAVAALLLRGLNLGIDFTGGSEFRVSAVPGEVSTLAAEDAVTGVVGDTQVQTTIIDGDNVRVRTGELSTADTEAVAEALAETYGVETSAVTSQFVGASWGEQISVRALQGLLVFLALVAVVISLYFRTWKMAVAALAALVLDMVFTVGIFAATGLEVTPSTVIGFLTVLAYSLYDTVVVFDKVRENTREALEGDTQTFAEGANLAVNQTLVRSINTSVVAILPVLAVLVIGVALLGASTLLDLALVLAIGTAVGTFSSIFVATPLLVQLREREEGIVAHDTAVLRRREGRTPVAAPAGPSVDVAEHDWSGPRSAVLAQSRQQGQRQQPRRLPRDKRG
ncbi:protein translocase subunit SecF [Aquipuribacter nitratireducens]|uniref:Protein-export membrane protein SecF n=1 Tax=Aquipuribacter nitratireducens TaxID=650104 RepID=A0ABW0GR52_9MICO